MFVHHVRALALTGIVFLTAAPVSACLVCTPAPHPTPTPVQSEPRPLPPTTLNYREVDGWRVGIAEYNAGDTFCNRLSSYIGAVVPGRNTTWLYYFKHSDGYTSQPIQVPAAPNIPGTTLGTKQVLDVHGPSAPGVGDSLVVVENGQAIQTAMIPLSCR